MRLSSVLPVLAGVGFLCGAMVPAAHAAGPNVVLSCPAKAGMKVMNVYLIKMPGDQVLPGSGGALGTEWDLTQVPLQHGEHVLLDCGYGAKSAQAGTPVAAKDHETRTIPAKVGRCFVSNSPVEAKCFAK